MKNMKKILTMMGVIALTAAIAIGGTLAYLTSQDSVTNTFTVGNVKITMDETDVDGSKTGVENGITPEGRDKANRYDSLKPAQSIVKDPIVRVLPNSEKCYLFLELKNDLKNIISSTNSIESQLDTNGWTPIAEGSKIYYRADAVSKSTDTQTFATFTNFTIDSNVDNNTLATYGPQEVTNNDGSTTTVYKTITVTAYAVQADGFSDAVNAWNNTFGKTAG